MKTKGTNMNMMSKIKHSDRPGFELVTVTPSLAESWLTANTLNRKINGRFVRMFAADMAKGRWPVTGDAIKFGPDGRLLDGQKRLSACIASGCSFQTYVAYGIHPDAQDVMDTGQARSSGDVLAIHGLKNTVNVASAYKLLLNERDENVNIGGNASRTNSEIMEAMEKHPKLPLYIPQPGQLPKGVSMSVVGYVNYVGSVLLRDPDTAKSMMQVLTTGVPRYEGCPMHRYREYLIRHREQIGGSVVRQQRIWMTFHAWNLFRDGEAIKQIRLLADRVPIKGLDLKKL